MVLQHYTHIAAIVRDVNVKTAAQLAAGRIQHVNGVMPRAGLQYSCDFLSEASQGFQLFYFFFRTDVLLTNLSLSKTLRPVCQLYCNGVIPSPGSSVIYLPPTLKPQRLCLWRSIRIARTAVFCSVSICCTVCVSGRITICSSTAVP